uniref:RNA polymerase sigma factor n=1 Tax=Labilibacter marinus TaxID=1477105 RepID=UPI00094FDD99
KSLGNFRGDSAMSTWIYRIAVNTSLTYTGKAFKQMQLIVSSDTQNLGMMYEDDEETIRLKEEQFEKLQSELNMLSVIDKALMSLILEGLSMKEIADVIGISEANVKVKIHRIKAQLKQNLSK